jgi:TetR/AcrR family transcriptional repressor of lmrAB and yxaGH operons
MSESTTKLLLIPALDEVFRRRGYEGATLSELARACNLGKASLYHHFPGGKDEMASLLLRRAVAELNEFAYRQLDRPAPWRERLCAFVDGFSHYCAGGTRNCLIAQFAATAARNRFGDEIQLQTERWMHQLTAAFSEIDAHEKRARRRARELLGTLYGALVVARLLNDPAPFELTIQRLRKGFAEESRSR